MTEGEEMLAYLNSLLAPPWTEGWSDHVLHRAKEHERDHPKIYGGLEAGVRAEYARLKTEALAQREAA